ncbi:MAG: YibE/F family protein [Treponema sp.]|nr:YibE/F family protein [Treponema sp.]
MIRISIPYLLTITASILFIIIAHNIAVNDMIGFQNPQGEYARAKIQKIVDRFKPEFDFLDDYDDFEQDSFAMVQGETIVFEAKVTHGTRKGEVITAEQTFSPLLMDRSKEVESGDSVLLVNNEIGWYFGGYIRTTGLLVLGIVFILCLLLFGGKKGFNTILSLGFTCTAIFAVFIPAILSGRNIYVMSLLVCAYTTSIVPLIVMGYNKKSLSAIAGCAAGIVISGIITLVMDKALHLTGIVDEHSRYLVNLPGEIQLNLNAVIFAGIIIGAMGAIMDVSISISSALWEIRENARRIQFKELLRSGINIGRDIMGTMSDTLILAYIGSSLTVVLLLSVYSGSALSLFNSEMIAVEILQALAGSLGILCAMPLTALFCSVIYLKEKKD